MDQHDRETHLTREALLTTEEVAIFLDVHPESVRRWARAGRIPAIRLAGRLLFRREDINRLLIPTRPGPQR
ncbi:MAG: helix-turn-helix domain-containing protein [Chloroflexi bacterium]|nr:helix-turn-helix domain-containing protein [Chloroflexota bacterium]